MCLIQLGLSPKFLEALDKNCVDRAFVLIFCKQPSKDHIWKEFLYQSMTSLMKLYNFASSRTFVNSYVVLCFRNGKFEEEVDPLFGAIHFFITGGDE